jgi:hypothetical protein
MAGEEGKHNFFVPASGCPRINSRFVHYPCFSVSNTRLGLFCRVLSLPAVRFCSSERNIISNPEFFQAKSLLLMGEV